MIFIKEVSKTNINNYWTLHWEYLNRDIFPFKSFDSNVDSNNIDYFKSDEYRGIWESYMDRDPDKTHFVYFYQGDIHIGCAHYVTYKSEDGKCIIADFWVFPEYRGNSIGHECYYALKNYVQSDGTRYISINVSNNNNHRFWKSLGFEDDGFDEWNKPLMRINLK